MSPGQAHDESELLASEQHQDSNTVSKRKDGGSARGHKKSLSGSLPSFAFLKQSLNGAHSSDLSSQTAANADSPQIFLSGSTAASAMDQHSLRRRKGSLRKTALLGTGKLRMNSVSRRTSSSSMDQEPSDFESSSSSLKEQSLQERLHQSLAANSEPYLGPPTPASPHDISTPRPPPIPPPVPMVTHPVHGDPSKISASTNESRPFKGDISKPEVAQSTASTTDDDDSPTSPIHPLPLTKSAMHIDSYFPLQPRTLPRPRPTTPKSRSPLATLPPTSPSTPPSEWDYSETRWWGWLILLVTWLVFVVGMGSCFEVWSWAWDVGETPYAPPELEDDPTLPIVGYYPALIILTTVMAWLWVTIAWVGMKYFKHANISGDEE